MFDFAWSEIALIGVVALVLIGPKDLPVAIKAVSDVVKKARRMASDLQGHVDEMVKDTSIAEVRQQINEIRNFDIRGEIERAVDADGSIRSTFNDDPFRASTPTPTSIPMPPPADPAPPLVAALPSAAPAFVPPQYAPPAPPAPPAFIPPDASRSGAAH
jgi:sec-independent protein translocase protein TatB